MQPYMALNIDLVPNKNESGASILRRFVRAFNDTGIRRKARRDRYYTRSKSELTEKKRKLHRIEDAQKYKELRRSGQIAA